MFIPSPGEWGRRFRLYGLMIALGVFLGLELARRQWAKRDGDPEDMVAIALWAVPAGLIGARLYHVITDNQLYRDGRWLEAFEIWNGGLGIPGGIIAGVGVGVYVAHRKGMRVAPAIDCAAVGLPLAQAIGRWGNYFNQELFGGPSDLPWALMVDPEHRPSRYAEFATFHPTFLYEMLWNIGLVLLLLWIDNKRIIRPGRLFALYIGGYFTGRLWVEAMRSDSANVVFGLRVNIWMSIIAISGVLLFLAIGGLRRRPGDSDAPYVDGHRFGVADPFIDGEGDAGVDGDPEASGRVVVDGLVSNDPFEGFSSMDDAVPTGDLPVGGTKARAERAGRQRLSGGSEKPDDVP